MGSLWVQAFPSQWRERQEETDPAVQPPAAFTTSPFQNEKEITPFLCVIAKWRSATGSLSAHREEDRAAAVQVSTHPIPGTVARWVHWSVPSLWSYQRR